MITLKVRNDISVATLTRLFTAIEDHFESQDSFPIPEILVYGVKDLRIATRIQIPREAWEELLDLKVENMPSNALKLIEEGL